MDADTDRVWIWGVGLIVALTMVLGAIVGFGTAARAEAATPPAVQAVQAR